MRQKIIMNDVGKTKLNVMQYKLCTWNSQKQPWEKMDIKERKSVIISPSHLGGKQDVKTRNEELDTTKFDKLGVINKETIINNHYQKSVMKNQCQITNIKNGVTNN